MKTLVGRKPLVIAMWGGLMLAGCTAEVQAYPAYTVAAPPPRDPEYYPHTVYEGQTVYYIDGRWYRHHQRGWVYYRTEPTELYRYRRSAPPARRARREEYRDVERHEERHGEREDRRDRGRREAPPSDDRPPEATRMR